MQADIGWDAAACCGFNSTCLHKWTRVSVSGHGVVWDAVRAGGSHPVQTGAREEGHHQGDVVGEAPGKSMMFGHRRARNTRAHASEMLLRAAKGKALCDGKQKHWISCPSTVNKGVSRTCSISAPPPNMQSCSWTPFWVSIGHFKNLLVKRKDALCNAVSRSAVVVDDNGAPAATSWTVYVVVNGPIRSHFMMTPVAFVL